jgi:hypothetical protein
MSDTWSLANPVPKAKVELLHFSDTVSSFDSKGLLCYGPATQK